MAGIDVTLGIGDLKRQYEHICDCLIKDLKYEELIFFKMGVELAARQGELAEITFGQVDLADLKVTRLMNPKTNRIIPYINISKELGELIREHMSGSVDEKIFKKPLHRYRMTIAKSTGDKSFSNHMMRHMGVMFNAEKMKNLIFRYRDELQKVNIEIIFTNGFGWIAVSTDAQDHNSPIKQLETLEDMEEFIKSQIGKN